MKSADCSASDGDKAERKNLSRENRPASINKSRERRHHHVGADKQNSGRKRKNGSGLDEGAQIIARSKKQPHGKNGGRKTIRDDYESQGNAAERESPSPRWRRRPLSRDHCEEHEHDTEQRSFQNPARPDKSQVNAQ